MTSVNGIKKRWIFNNLGFVVGIFVVLVVAFNFMIRGYFYSGIQQAVLNRSKEVYTFFKDCCGERSNNFAAKAVDYIEEVAREKKFEVMIFDKSDEVILTSAAFLPQEMQTYPDYWEAKNKDVGVWVGRSTTGEKILAVSRSLYCEDGEYIGTIRYVVSLETARGRIYISTLLLMFIELLIILFMIFSATYFIKSIVNPVSDISAKSRLIAQGNFNIKIDKKYNDEIGQLSDAINNMAAELKESEKLKNDFISSISHELRTPLTAIKGWAETMQICDSDPATMKRGLEVIVKEAGRLSSIVEEMLDFSSMRERKVKLVKEKIDILAELSEAVYMFKNRAEHEKKSLIYSEPKMLPTVLGDKNRLKQVFINIIDNALKYTSEGGGVSVSTAEKDGEILISVTDNGCGIPSEHLPNVKKKFYKANHLQRGSGIGLAIVDEIVELHGGRLEIISEEGFGTTVTVVLPVYSANTVANGDSYEGT